jgi:transcription-repair coupling factor (superfamily II helicase)
LLLSRKKKTMTMWSEMRAQCSAKEEVSGVAAAVVGGVMGKLPHGGREAVFAQEEQPKKIMKAMRPKLEEAVATLQRWRRQLEGWTTATQILMRKRTMIMMKLPTRKEAAVVVGASAAVHWQPETTMVAAMRHD